MSVTLARSAFTEAGKGLRLERLEMHYANDGNNSQIMDIAGYHADGTPFTISSGPVDPGLAPMTIARNLAAKVLAGQLDQHLTRTIDDLNSGARPLGAAQPEEAALPESSDPLVPEAAPATPAPAVKPPIVDDIAVPRMPHLNGLLGNFGKLTESVEAACAAINKRMARVGADIETNAEKFNSAIDPIEAAGKQIGAAANALSNGGAPLERSKI